MTTDSGLRYSVLAKGKGEASPKPGDLVRFHYLAWLEDGTLVESSLAAQAQVEVILGVAMCKAWIEGIQRMHQGTRCKIVAPSELAYGKIGSKGTPPAVPPVPPGATLVFEIELLGFEPCIDLPEFKLPDLKRQKKTKGGVPYVVMGPGKGRMPRKGEGFEVEISTFNERGQLLGTSRDPKVPSVYGRVGSKVDGPAFLTDAISVLPLGERVQFKVPSSMYGAQDGGHLLPPGSDTFWLLRLVRLEAAREVPTFRRLKRGQARRSSTGLRFEEVTAGSGPKPSASSRVIVHYAGWNSRGDLFDNSMERGVPISFVLDDPKVLPGWAEGILRMQKGSVFRFSVPGPLGYGMIGRKDHGIGPNETLHFHIELVGFEDSRP